jgi:hypothetical protein
LVFDTKQYSDVDSELVFSNLQGLVKNTSLEP